ncbi:MAG: Flp pilus assembly complex ATPase component TadA [Candidatus Omnitrophica bacterium]|nr:Flp pilus assembly complex ATPase component TadA [Candidatus Omnitrophota bacterium]
MLSYKKIISEGLKNLGIVKEYQLQQALKLQETSKGALGQILVELGFISGEKIVLSLATQFGVQPKTIDPLQVPDSAAELVDYNLALRHRVIAIKSEQALLTLATDNLFNFLAVDNLSKFLEKNLDLVFIAENDFNSLLDKIYGERKEKKTPGADTGQTVSSSEFLRQAQEVSGKDDAPIVRLVTLLLKEAYQNRASDVHLEPLQNTFRIRYRIDGVLQEVPGPPKRLQGSLISRIKIMASMDIAEKRLPQDGRIKFKVEEKELDLRVSTVPAIHGENVVVRILDRSRLILDLEQLGFSPQDKLKYENLLKLPNGIILVTGPTGCGKTTTLYTSLAQINKPNKKLLTLEDPVEYQMAGVNQVQVKPEIGLSFASGLRSMLRQAPDIIMVGEIRDFETAAIAIQASLTGHLIFSTLHTNDAPGAITRLIDMGVKPYLVSSTLQGVLAQRLVRTLCTKCKQPDQPTEEKLRSFNKTSSQIKGITFYKPGGCPECLSGFRGRIGIVELLILDEGMRSNITEHYSATEIRELAKSKGMCGLREDGWLKAAQGITTLEEVLRVTQ